MTQKGFEIDSEKNVLRQVVDHRGTPVIVRDTKKGDLVGENISTKDYLHGLI